MSIHYSEKLNEIITNVFEPKFLEYGFSRSKNVFKRKIDGVLQQCSIQKSRANSSIFASFYVSVGIYHHTFAKIRGLKQSESLLFSIPLQELVEKAFQKKTYLDWYCMGDIPGLTPYGGISEATFDLEDPFTRYDRVWKDPSKLIYILQQDIDFCIVPFFEATSTEEKLVRFVEVNDYNLFLSQLGRQFIDEKS
ncbi:DUF4304 domain-containing protein [Paenibacillus sp. sgz302251]|uniref:DUF4304 domain-containing protein n=1 Tax=Paenibacillus sp. sgz302251 TaxID=3414493 RepID=UPI003C7E2298